MNLDQFYKQIVLDHAKSRRNYREMDGYTHKVHYKNPTCGDVMTLYARLDDNHIEDISFIGEGCFISMASSSMFTTIGKGKSLDELNDLSALFNEMIVKGKEVEDERLEEAVSLKDIHQLPARYNCALMPWQAFQKLMKEDREIN
ncbi:SUF system NifU family Fe-S cluster assembly protein [Sutcliffiella horikoshii]|uniref:SUF system NifU family Fe-S cluster assembly protein n=1 Tax=Sutcliffiella horikoshii TaxID=79883 RepID=A0A5D4SCU1_9BACI|nr:SUF system NifU family Fe-S cluster assembly protein [Sutcliffiella horikoshii]TYS59526.1 SUF system NifU family Fe-S cluster assembly protein [Sutcliffiella horikoshii]